MFFSSPPRSFSNMATLTKHCILRYESYFFVFFSLNVFVEKWSKIECKRGPRKIIEKLAQLRPKMVPKLVWNRVLERTWCCSTFLHDFCMFFVLFSINFLDAFLLGLLAFFPEFLDFLKTAEVHFGVTSSRILRFGRVSTRERFSKRFAKMRKFAAVFAYEINRKFKKSKKISYTSMEFPRNSKNPSALISKCWFLRNHVLL